MTKKFLACTAVSIGLLFSGAAYAQSYSSDSIIDFLINSLDMGKSRGLCVGTVDECSTGKPDPSGFDMLVNFDYNSADLNAAAKVNLEQIAIALKDQRLSAAKFVVEGHTDAKGSENYNLSLSEQRAHSVTSFLLERGVKSGKVTAIGKGESAPRATDGLDPVNRRVEIRVNF